jgi:hypothetical protein
MRRVAALRVSILVSLGLVPVACGGSVREQRGDNGTSGSGGSGDASKPNRPDRDEPPVAVGTGGVTSIGTGGSSAPNLVGGYTSAGGSIAVGTAGSFTMGTAGAGGAVRTADCTHPVPDAITGLVACDEGYSHRPKAQGCLSGEIGGAPNVGGAAGEGGYIDQESLPRAGDDAVTCQFGAAGACSEYQWGYCRFVGMFALCGSGCLTDADCGTNSVCVCGDPQSPTGGACLPAQCRTDADCGSDSLCASYTDSCGQLGYSCLSPGDECRTREDCSSCEYRSDEQRRVCTGFVCGRPFLVDEQARVAAAVRDSAWATRSDDALPDVASLSPFERAAQAARWTKMGQLEHASIAAFARFSLQLLSLGAPPELVEGCTAALVDETEHAKLCFRMASAFAGHPVGPGPLDVSGSLIPTSLADVVDLVIAEGCFGETLATLEAQEAAAEAADPVIGAAFTRVAIDEQRHAELAFRFLRWALEQDPAGVRTHITRAIDSCIDHSSGARDVVIPCLLALLRNSSSSLEIAS